MHKIRSLALALSALLATPSTFAETTLFKHSSVRTAPQKVKPSKATDKAGADGIRSRLRAQPAIKSITYAKDGGTPKTVWNKTQKEDALESMDSNTLQCVAVHLANRLKSGTEVRIACKFFEPQVFIAALLHTHGVLELEVARLKSTDPTLGATPESLKEKYKVFGFENGDAKWTPQEFAIVDEALAYLNQRELNLIADVPFVREVKNRQGRMVASGSLVAGLYQPAPGKNQSKIYIYDAFTQNKGIIMGTGKKHVGAGTMSLLHEIGHALASSLYRKQQNSGDASASDADAGLKKKRDAAHQVYLAAKAEFDAKSPSMTQPERNAAIEALNKKIYAFNDLDNAYKKKAKAQNAFNRKQERSGKPAEAAYTSLLPVRKGVTPYARTSHAEAFAEGYMLFKLDPEALKRISPKAHAYFETGKYLDIIDAELKAGLK